MFDEPGPGDFSALLARSVSSVPRRSVQSQEDNRACNVLEEDRKPVLIERPSTPMDNPLVVL
jgi:hypothetical protein